MFLDPPSLDLPEASVQGLHELLLGDDAALAGRGLIVFFVLRHSCYLPNPNGPGRRPLRQNRQDLDARRSGCQEAAAVRPSVRRLRTWDCRGRAGGLLWEGPSSSVAYGDAYAATR